MIVETAVIAETTDGFPAGSLATAFALIAVNGFFVATEFALLASMRSRVEVMVEEGRPTARLALSSMARLGTMLAGSQLGITIASVALGSVGEPAVAGVLTQLLSPLGVPHRAADIIALIIALAVVVFLHLLFGEMLPKSLALAAPERTLLVVAAPARGFIWLFRPVIWALNATARAGARLFGVEQADELSDARTSAEIGIMLNESVEEGLLESEESDLLAGALAFEGRTVGEVMVPVADIVAVGVDDPIEIVEEVFARSGHSRLVIRDVRDKMMGYLHVKDVLPLALADRSGPVPRSALRVTFSIPPDLPLGALLYRMRQNRVHLALVMDSKRVIIGMVTLEEVIESIVGDITDETDGRLGMKSHATASRPVREVPIPRPEPDA